MGRHVRKLAPRNCGCGRAYRPAVARRTTLSSRRSDDATDRTFDQCLVLDDRDGFVRAVSTAARDNDRKFFFGRHVRERNRQSRAKALARNFALAVGLGFRAASLPLGGHQGLESARLLLDKVLEAAERNLLALRVG